MLCVMCLSGLPGSCLGMCSESNPPSLVTESDLSLTFEGKSDAKNSASDYEANPNAESSLSIGEPPSVVLGSNSRRTGRNVETRSSSNRTSGKRDATLKDGQSTGRKRAAKMYPLDKEATCEWRGQSNCGGGKRPIIGCVSGLQQARHHGPDKSVANNEQGNVHRICHYCLDSSMRVLTMDLRWIEARNLVVGQELLGFDEDIKFRAPELQKSIVKSINIVQEPMYKFIMDTGIELISTHKHMWVGSSPGRHHISWRTTESLKIGYNLRLQVKPWENILSDYNAGWLAGYLDGEGSLSGYHLSHAQKNGSIYDKANSLLLDIIEGKLHTTKRPSVQYNNIIVDRVTNLPDIMTVLGSVRPLRLLEKWPSFVTYKQAKGKLSSIKHIEYLGIQEAYSIETSTHTMIVEGYQSHNCHNRWHAANNYDYDWNDTTVQAHNPRPMNDKEREQALLDHMKYATTKAYRTKIKD